MADAEKGDKNEEISDAKKLDALADMIKDACSKLDAAGERLDARMDALEERQQRMDARFDARKDEDEEEERKDASEEEEERKDEDEKEERKDARRKDEDEDERKDSRRRDSEGERQKEGYVEDRKDEDEDERERKDARRKDEDEDERERKDSRRKDEDDDEAAADRSYVSRAEADDLRQQIADLQRRAPAIISDSERDRFAAIQEQAEPAFQAFGDRAPAPLQGETPTQYKRRLGSKMQAHSDKWKDARLSAVSDEAMLDAVVNDIYADSIAAARRGVDVPNGQLRAIERSMGGHTIIEYEGGPDAWMNGFAGNSQRGTGTWLRPH